MKTHTLLTLAFAAMVMTSSAESRTWKDKRGHAIEAEYKGMENGKAVLLRQDGKQILIDPALLSDADQAYIRQANSVGSEQGATASSAVQQTIAWITTQEAQSIARTFTEAISERNFNQWRGLILHPEEVKFNGADIDEVVFAREVMDFRTARVEEVDQGDHGFDARIVVVREWRDGNGGVNETEDSHWVQMLPDGKIKYDDIFLKHPVKRAIYLCSHGTLNIKHGNVFYQGDELVSLGVPLFGFDPAADGRDQLKSLKKIADWLKNDSEEWDATDPSIPCPPEAHKSWIKTYFSDM